jgi:predicted DNA-binding ribbon-helix-helix protein
MPSKRFINLETHTTSIELERTFWDTIDRLSAESGRWQDWVKEKLKAKPKSVGRASYLRQLAHQAVLNEIQLNA